MTGKKRPALVVDLDGTLNHAKPCAGGFPIRGRTTDSFLSPQVLARLARIAGQVDIIVATGRSRQTAGDFRAAFAQAGVPIFGWILEHGAVVRGRPEWAWKVLNGLDPGRIHRALSAVIRERRLPIDGACYAGSHEHTLLFSGNGALLAEHFIACAAEILNDDFRSIVGRRKIALVPSRADKYAAFAANFGATHHIAFAAGDQPDDLTILQQAAFPLSHADAHPIVRQYVRDRGGYIAPGAGHAGAAALLDMVLARTGRRMRGPVSGDDVQGGVRIPVEASDYFRPSRRTYLERLFRAAPAPDTKPDPFFLTRLGRRLDEGRSVVLEVRMRDWGGEAKPLAALVSGMLPYLPHARWRLWFRKERRGVENLTDFNAVARRLEGMACLPGGGPRFSAPGVPGSPPDPGPAGATLLLYDHPEDLGAWYAAAMPRLITRHPTRAGVFWVNPMYLKISGAVTSSGRRPLSDTAARVMMAANVIGETDIRIAFEGFAALRDEVDALIIAPRVVTNPARNRMIREAAEAIGERAVPLSTLGAGERPCIVWVDTYGDLPYLYGGCRFTYLGGGFDPRKRGFDPVESLAAGVPVVMGPLCDYNRIAARCLEGTGWITLLDSPGTAVSDVVAAVRRRMADRPDPDLLDRFFRSRRIDGAHVALEVMADLAGMSRQGYLLPEHRIFARDRISLDTLLRDPNGAPGKST